MPIVLEIGSIAELNAFRGVWQSLLAQTPEASFFHSLEWLEVYWRHYGESQTLRVLVVAEGDRVTGILPLAICNERTKVGAVRLLTYPLGGWSSFYGAIGPDPAGTLRAGFDYLRSTRRNWDVLELRWIKQRPEEHDLAERALREAGFEAETKEFEQVAMIDLTGTWDEYWSRTKAHERSNIRRGERKLQGLGKLTHVRHRPQGEAAADADPRWDLFEACQFVAGKSWQGNADDGTTLSNEAVSAFYRDSHLAATQAGVVYSSLLQLDGQAVAFSDCYQYRRYVYVLKVGFDPALSHAGVGKILLARTIEQSFALGDRTIDLGPESLHYKRFWLTRLETSYRTTHFPASSPRAQALRLARWARGLVAGDADREVAEEPAASA